MGFLYFCNMSSLRYAVEDRKADAVAHLACVLGVKIQGTAFWGILQKIKGNEILAQADFIPLFHQYRIYKAFKKDPFTKQGAL